MLSSICVPRISRKKPKREFKKATECCVILGLNSRYYAHIGIIMHNRIILERLLKKSGSRLGRIVALTGARQTGKTTLAKEALPDYSYILLDDPIVRPQYLSLTVPQWYHKYPQAVLDEIQKAPQLFETVKGLYDVYSDCRYLLTGSSQILLMDRVKESLAGRMTLMELYPLTLPEMQTQSWQDEIKPSLLIQCLHQFELFKELSASIPAASERYPGASKAFEDYLQYGAYPTVHAPDLLPEEKREWLDDYVKTYLQRDVRDLANLRELEPFINAQHAVATLTGCIVNYSELATLASISPKTAKRFLTYLEMSYQVFTLRPWFRNTRKRLSKSPKIHFMDPGILRAVLRRQGPLTGQEFESTVVAEIYKQLKSYQLDARLFHLNTADGREIDLLIEMENGYIPIEIKQANKVNSSSARHLHQLETILDKPIIHSLVLSNDNEAKSFGDKITALPVAFFLGTS